MVGGGEGVGSRAPAKIKLVLNGICQHLNNLSNIARCGDENFNAPKNQEKSAKWI